jgi:hypothetical protein
MEKEKKTTEVVKTEEASVTEVANGKDNMVQTLITQAIDKGTPVETLERLLAMRKELKAEHAKEQFDVAMAGFQAECPIIEKKKIVMANGKERYRYAPIESIVEQTKEYISKYGFSYTIRTTSDESMFHAIVKVSHKDGHSEESTFSIPISQEQFMTEVQKFGARSTFAKRYAFLNAFGIMTGDEDTNANEENPSKKEVKENHLDLLKRALIKQGAKNATEAITIFNNLTGMGITELPKTNGKEAEEMFDNLVGSPNYLK